MEPNRNLRPDFNGKPRILRPGETPQQVAMQQAILEHNARAVVLEQLSRRVARLEAGFGFTTCPICNGKTPVELRPDGTMIFGCETCNGCSTVPPTPIAEVIPS